MNLPHSATESQPLARDTGVVQRLANVSGLSKVEAGGLLFDLHRIGLGNDISRAGVLSCN